MTSRQDWGSIAEIANINPETTNASWNGREILYIDISSVGEGCFNSEPEALLYDEAPSRARRVVRHGDVLISTVRPNRRSMIQILNPRPNTVASTGFALLRPKRIEDSDYLFGIISNKQFTLELEMLAYGAAYPAVRTEDICRPHVYLPKEHERDRISNFLGPFIRLHHSKAPKILQECISTLFHSWFIKFDPVRAKVAGKRPFGMDEQTAALFPDSFEDSEIGPIPAGWTLTRIGDIADLTKGLSYKGDFLEESDDLGKKMMNLGCFGIDGSFRRNKIKFYSGPYRERHVLEQGDLLIANTDMTQDRVILGACIVIPAEFEGALFTHHTTRLRVHKNHDSKLNSFIAYQLYQTTFRHIAEGYSTGSTVLALPKDAILNYHIAMPPKELLENFLDIEAEFFSQIQNQITTEEFLRKTRDVLLPRLMAGELTLPEAD